MISRKKSSGVKRVSKNFKRAMRNFIPTFCLALAALVVAGIIHLLTLGNA